MARWLKIQSDGTQAGTRVFVVDEADPDAAPQPLKRVTGVAWKIEAGEKAIATVTVESVEVDVVGQDPEERPAG